MESLGGENSFLIEEYKALRAEILQRITELGETQRLAAIGSAAIWAWLTSKQGQSVYVAGRYIPLALSTLLYLRWVFLDSVVQRMGDYLQGATGSKLPLDGGWEAYRRRFGTRGFGTVLRTFWLTLLVANFLAVDHFRVDPGAKTESTTSTEGRGTVPSMDATTTRTQAVSDDDDLLAQLDAIGKQKAEQLAVDQKTGDVSAARELLKRRAAGEGDVFIAGDSGGTFRGIFAPPSMELWKKWKADMRGDQQRAVANQNLVTSCLKWPDRAVLVTAAEKRPALYDVIGAILQAEAGSGQEALTRK